MASYLQARQKKGLWYLRIDDIDPPREQRGASKQIIQSLALHGFHWDDSIQYQSQHTSRFEQALARLYSSDHLFYCKCSRKQIAKAQSALTAGASFANIYPGTCRKLKYSPIKSGTHAETSHPTGLALRFRVSGRLEFNDVIQGRIVQDLEKEVGDFVIKRRDGLYGYQLANVVDDTASEITHVVRGADLLDNTPRQIALINALGFNVPEYAHLPIAVNSDGTKLSKQTRAAALDNSVALSNLLAAWRFLGQTGVLLEQHRTQAYAHNRIVVNAILSESTEAFWEQAVQDWEIRRVPREMTRPTIYP